MPIMAQVVPPPAPSPTPMTPEQHAQESWAWLRANCAPSTWAKFVASVAVRQPEVKGWVK